MSKQTIILKRLKSRFQILNEEVFRLNNWLSMLFNNRKLSPFLKVFRGRRRMTKGMIWSSVLSIGMSAAAYGLNRKRSNNGAESFQGPMKNRNMKTLQAAMVEFADEIAPDSKRK
jgi:hypothetical protein